MKKSNQSDSVKRFLEFNEKRIPILFKDGIWWIATKPICDALGVDWNHQHRYIKSEEILGPASSIQTMQVTGEDQRRELFCLPEQYIYGWIFSIRSDAEGLVKYRRACYDVLYQYFHGTVTGRRDALNRRLEIDKEIKLRVEKLLESEDYKALQSLKLEKTSLGQRLTELDKNLITGQMSFDFKSDDN